MTKGPPWMPLNVADYLKDTSHLSAHEHGAYVLLILRYWQDGGLPGDEMLIRRYSLLSAEQWIESRPVLAALFDEGWRHRRIDAELIKAAGIIDKRRSAAEQRHSKTAAPAEQMESSRSYAGVPPLPEPESTPPRSSVPGAADGRVEFARLWEAFPRNPSSSQSKAMRAWERIGPNDRAIVHAAAVRFATWFAQDCQARNRTLTAGLSYVPHLSRWLDGGLWREAAKLPVAGETDPALTVIDAGSDDFRALVRHRGRTPFVGGSGKITVPLAELAEARGGVHSEPREAADDAAAIRA